MSNKLYIFGDSWPAGYGLEKPADTAFPILVSKQLDLVSINLATPGTSIDQAVHCFLNTINKISSSDKILFCLSGISRTSIFENDQLIELHPMSKTEISKFYFTRMYTEMLGNYNCLKHILLVQEMAKVRNITAYFTINWDDFPTSDLIDYKYVLQKSLLSMITNTNKKLDSCVDWNTVQSIIGIPLSDLILANHPTEKGHKLIAKEIISWINSR